MMMPVVAMLVVTVSNGNNHLRIRCGYQRREEQQGEEAKQNLLHTSSDAPAATGVVAPTPYSLLPIACFSPTPPALQSTLPMAYQVLARKYRPQRFADVIGQDHVTRTLLNALSQNRIAHGYIFSGHRGIGKTTIARILASALNCRTEIGSASPPHPEPCGICESCIEIRRQRRRRHRDRRRHQPRHRRDPRTPRRRPLPPLARQVQDLHPRRGAPDHRRRLQRAAQDPRRAARPHRLHDGHHPARGHPADHPLALPALQLPRRQARRHRRPAPPHRHRRAHHRRRRHTLAARRSRRRLHARRPLHHGPGHRLRAHRRRPSQRSTPPRSAS